VTAPRRIYVELLGGVLLFALGAGSVFFGRPARVELQAYRHEIVRLQEVQKLVLWDAVTKSVEREQVTKYVRYTAPSGAVSEQGEVIYRERAKEDEQHALTFDVARTEARDTTTKETRITTNQPRWTLGFGVAAAPTFAPLAVGPQYLAFVSYRLLGPFSLGAFATFTQANLQPSLGLVGTATLP
jgi:hypothetical protein